MEIMFLGTGSGVPAQHRNVSSLVLKMLNERNTMWMFDCGEATQHQILKTTLKPRKIEKIFITHLHGDHIYGLPGFLSSRAFQGGEEPVDLYGPVGLKKYILTTFKISKTYLPYRIRFHEISDDEGLLFEENGIKVTYGKLNHGIDCYGYRIEEEDKPGTLLVDRLKEDKIPSGPIYGKLKAGETVELEDGRIIDGKDYLGPEIKGTTLAILGDTRFTPRSISLAKDADVLVHEATFSQADQDLAYDYYHSTTADAARVAKEAGVKQLLLNHISGRYVGQMAKDLEKEAQAIFPQTQLMYDLNEYVVN